MALVWTPEKAAVAQQNGKYIAVPSGNRRLISGAENVWSRDKNILYHSGYRITGTESDIRRALAAAGINQMDINDVIATSINGYNYNTTMREVYLQEIGAFRVERAARTAATQEVEFLVRKREIKNEMYELLLQDLETRKQQLRTAILQKELTNVSEGKALVSAVNEIRKELMVAQGVNQQIEQQEEDLIM